MFTVWTNNRYPTSSYSHHHHSHNDDDDSIHEQHHNQQNYHENQQQFPQVQQQQQQQQQQTSIDIITTKDSSSPQRQHSQELEQQIPSPLSSPSSPQLDKARKAGKYLQLLLHCQRCNGECNDPIMCKHAKLLHNHSIRCTFSQCPIDGCHQTKKLLQHFTLCRWERKKAKLCGNEIKECLMCSYIGLDENENDQQHQRSSYSDHDHDFTLPLPPKRLRADNSLHFKKNNNHHESSNGNNTHDSRHSIDQDNTDDGEEADDETTTRIASTCRYRSVSHAPDNLNIPTRSSRTGSI